MTNTKVKCVNATDRCEGSHPCPYCEPEIPLRDDITGKFVAVNQLPAMDRFFSNELDKIMSSFDDGTIWAVCLDLNQFEHRGGIGDSTLRTITEEYMKSNGIGSPNFILLATLVGGAAHKIRSLRLAKQEGRIVDNDQIVH